MQIRTQPTSQVTTVTAPTSEPVSLAEARKQCELSPTDNAHDDHLLRLIQTAREQWEHDTDSCCLTQSLSVTLPDFEACAIALPKRPVQSITHIKYYDGSNTLQTLATSVYGLDPPTRTVRLQYLQNWPTVIGKWNSVIVTFVAGYTSAANVPAIHKQAILFLIGHYFENRDMILSEALQSLTAYERLVGRFMRSDYP